MILQENACRITTENMRRNEMQLETERVSVAQTMTYEDDKKTILIIDDEPFILSATSRRLQEAGYLVYTCELWGRVPGFMRNVKPDLVLLDYNMPSLKGDQICNILKQNTQNENTKVILFSAEGEDFLKKIAVKCGADGYIQKTLPPEKFIARIETILKNELYVGKDDGEDVQQKTILIVDDSPIARRITRRFIAKQYNCKFTEAANGLEGLHQLSMFPQTALILLDINMPVMNGVKFLETIRRERKYTNIPIVVCSTEGKESSIMRSLSLGASGYIIKPFAPNDLYSIVDKIFERTRSK